MRQNAKNYLFLFQNKFLFRGKYLTGTIMSLRDSIERRLIKQKLWNDSEFPVEESLLGMAMINPGLIVLEGCQAILRRDYDNMPGRVRHIFFNHKL